MQDVFSERRRRLVEELSFQGISCAIITNVSDIIFFTGISYQPMERLLALVLDVVWNRAVLVIPAFEKGKQENVQGVEELDYMDSQDSIALLATTINNVGRIGIQKFNLSLLRAEQLAAQTRKPLSLFRDISQEISKLRLHKDAYEIANLRKVCQITCDVLEQWKNYVKPGINERELRLHLDHLTEQHGANESCPGILIASGIHSSSAHGLGYGRDVKANEPIFIDCGARWNYYYCDITRTFFTGKPTALMENVYQVVQEAQAAALEIAKPGRMLKEIDEAARRVIVKAGFGAYFTHRTGHGLGLDVHELPSVAPGSTVIAEEGMVFTIEPGIYLPEVGGVRIEDDVLVTAEGIEVLTQFPKDLASMIL